MKAFELKFVTVNDQMYEEAVAIRIEQFFKNRMNDLELINDDCERSGIHLVCVKNKMVVGTGRLNIESKTGIISQMAIKTAFQNRGIGSSLLNEFIKYCKNQKLKVLRLSARETALSFYKKFDFKTIGSKYPSKKTGIIHQQMVLNLE